MLMFKKISPIRKKVCKSEESERVLQVLRDYVEGHYDTPMKWLVNMWRDQSLAITYKELRSIVTDEDLPEQIFNDWYKDYSTMLASKMTDAWREAMANSWRSNPLFEGIDTFQFNNGHERVMEYLTNRSSNLVTNCLEEQREAIRYVISECHAEMKSSAETARYLRSTIGLTEPQASANLKLYNSVKEQLRENHPRMRDDAIERKAREASAKYAAKQQMFRAETIARTELAHAYNNGNDEAIRQAMEQGLMPIMEKVWAAATASGKVCPACLELNGKRIGMDDEFSVTIGKRVIRTITMAIPPLHPRCMCAVKYIEVKTVAKPEENATIKPTAVTNAHTMPPKCEPGTILDHVGKKGVVETRTFYGDDGYKFKEITNHNHGNPKWHPYGEHGEHAHDYKWDENGKMISRTTREITPEERKENSEVL